MNIYHSEIPSPLGPLRLVGDDEAMRGLYMTPHRHAPALPRGCRRDDAAFRHTRAQLDAYFAGERTDFELALASKGSEFQRLVWDALSGIPFGETVSYGQLAQRISRPRAARAVGLANGRNPISILVPCHRVIGADGSLTGYGGGLRAKRWLLQHEGGMP